jgi:hypothetical protein
LTVKSFRSRALGRGEDYVYFNYFTGSYDYENNHNVFVISFWGYQMSGSLLKSLCCESLKGTWEEKEFELEDRQTLSHKTYFPKEREEWLETRKDEFLYHFLSP